MNRRDSVKEGGQEIKSRIPREHQQPLYKCSVDFKKAFDSISHDKCHGVVGAPWIY